MQIAKRVVLFIVVNFLVLITVSLAIHIFGLDRYLYATGMNYQGFLIIAVLWGFGGSFISLLISKPMAKWSMGVKTVDPQTHDPNERWLLETVYSLARRAGIEGMPEVGVFPSPEVNAFATGATKNGALVAVSAGLLNSMDKNQVEAVLGHEITHVSNGDMVTMTLIQGVINVFVIFLSYVLSIFLTQGSKNERGGGGLQFLIRIILQIVLSILGSIVVAAFSRWREFRADEGGANLAGRQKMISALEALKEIQERRLAPEPSGSGALATLKINGHRGGLLNLFASHPPLEDRIERLRGLSEARPSSLIR